MFPAFLTHRYPNVLFATWGEAAPVLSADSKKDAWTVPADIMALIPASTKRILNCVDGKLVVLRNLDVGDFFAGRGRIARVAELVGLRPVALDREYGSHLDLLTPEGLATAICSLLRIVPGGLLFMGPQCSSWVWMCRSQTKRSAANPYGNLEMPAVIDGNRLNEICALLCAIASMLGVLWVIEQPGSSLFFHTKLMRTIINKENAYQRHVPMSQFGHESQKSTLLVGVADFLSDLGKERKQKIGIQSVAKVKNPKTKAKSAPRKKTKAQSVPRKKAAGKATAKAKAKTATSSHVKLAKVTTRGGKKQVTGNKVALKNSQVYPVQFAVAVVRKHWPHLQ